MRVCMDHGHGFGEQGADDSGERKAGIAHMKVRH